MIGSIMKDMPREVILLRNEVPHHLARIICHSLDKNPEHRFQSPKDVHNQLLDLRRQEISQMGGGLRAISRTIAMQYQDNHPSLKQIGNELGFDFALEGPVRRARTAEGRERVRITR